MNTIRTATDDEVAKARANVTDSINDALTAAVSGNSGTGSPAVSSITVMIYNDGDVETRIAGLVNKVTLFGALVEAILSLHELDKSQADAALYASVSALAEKAVTKRRTDN